MQTLNLTVSIFDDKTKCVDRVTQDLLSNIEEYFEIQNSLTEINQLIAQSETTPYEDDYLHQLQMQDNREIQERLENALRVNLSQKQILKEILIKVGEDNKHEIQNLQLQMRQQQLEMLNLLKINQELNNRVQQLESELKLKKSNNSDFDKMSTTAPMPPSSLSGSERETFKTALESNDAYFSVENIPERSSKKESICQPIIKEIKLVDQGTANSRYQSQAKIIKDFSANIIQLNQVKSIKPRQSKDLSSAKVRSSCENNPLMSSYESEYNSSAKKRSFQEQDFGSPTIKQNSRTLASQFGKGGSFLGKSNYSSNMLILD